MPLYRYKTASQSGEINEGEMFAPDENAVIAKIHASGEMPIRISPARQFGRLNKRGVRNQDIQVFTHELATLLAAGLPLDKSLQIIVDLSEDPRLAGMTSRLLEAVRGGASLSDAIEAQAGVFSRFYISMIRAGEMGGAMEQVLSRLSEYLVRARELRDSVLSALIYPAILITVSVLSVFVLMVFVVPHFTQLFDDAGEALPLLTQVVVGSAEFLRNYWWVIGAGLLAGLLILQRQISNPASRLRLDARLLRLPLVGDLVRKMETARMSRTLGTLLGNGVPVLAAMAIVRETLGNRAMESGLATAVEGLKEGQGMSGPLMEAKLFPSLGMQMIKVGEETGRLQEMLMQVADIYDREVRLAIQRMLALLEPVLIVSLGLIIATIIMSILTAIVSVNELVF